MALLIQLDICVKYVLITPWILKLLPKMCCVRLTLTFDHVHIWIQANVCVKCEEILLRYSQDMILTRMGQKYKKDHTA